MKAIPKGNYLAQYGPMLIENGYSIVPIKRGCKYPKGLNGWENIQADTRRLDFWLETGYSKDGVGILTKHTPAIDIDVLDLSIVEQLVQWCEKHIGPTVQRVGNPPKTLLVFQAEQPFQKVSSRKFIDEQDQQHQVEVLGNGQQCVAYAIHPETHQPYEWVSQNDLANTPRTSLPILTQEKARELMDHFESIVPSTWKVVAERQERQSRQEEVDVSERMLMNAKPTLNITNTTVLETLGVLSSDDYHQWIKVGMALYHQYEGTFDGFDFWDNWSRESHLYDETVMGEKWKSFEVNLLAKEPVTFASVLRDAMIAKAQAGKDQLAEFLKQFVYVQDGDRVCDLSKPPHMSLSKLSEFKNRMANVSMSVPSPTKTDPDRCRPEYVHKMWLIDEKRLTAEGIIYKPGAERMYTDEYGLSWVNEYHTPVFSTDRNSHSLDVFFEHMAYLFPIPKEREWFIDWMAFNIQHPEKRCKVTPLHISVEHGTGRGWIVELMRKLLGSWNLTKTKMNILAGEGNGAGFHDYFHKSLLCAVEEVKEGSRRYSISDRIRDLLTESSLEINLKHGSKRTQAVFTNFFFMSNHPDAIVLTEQDRRINVFQGPNQPKDSSYYDRLYDWLETKAVGCLYHTLKARDLNDFDWKRSMSTAARTRMIESNRTQTEALFWEMMNEPPQPVMSYQQIIEYLPTLSELDAFEVDIEGYQLQKLLQHYGTHLKAIKVQGKTTRPWQIVKGVQLTNEQIREYLKPEHSRKSLKVVGEN